MNDSGISYILQNTLLPIFILFIWIFFYWWQKKVTKSNPFTFLLRGAYKRTEYVFSFSLISIFIALYIVIGYFLEAPIPIAGPVSFEIYFNFVLISVVTLMCGLVYGSFVATFGNIFAYFISRGTSGYLFTFTFIRAIMPAIPFLLYTLYTMEIFKNKKYLKLILKSLISLILCTCLIVSIILYTGLTQYSFHKSVLLVFLILSSISLFVFVFIIIFSYYYKKSIINEDIFYLTLLIMLFYHILVGLIIDSALKLFIFSIHQGLAEVILLKLPITFISFFVTSFLMYYLLNILKGYKNINFLLSIFNEKKKVK